MSIAPRLVRLLALSCLVALVAVAAHAGQEKQSLCHFTDSEDTPYTVITVAEPAWDTHLAHGDLPFVDCCMDSDCAEGEICGEDGACEPQGCGETFVCGKNFQNFACSSTGDAADGFCGATPEGGAECVGLIAPATCSNFRAHKCQETAQCDPGSVCVIDTCTQAACGFAGVCLPVVTP